MLNYFHCFNLQPQFDINLAELEKKYFALQQEFHPDATSSTSDQSAQINAAYQILSDDFLRACHLLQLQNINILNDELAPKPDLTTLEEIFELQEKISEITNKAELTTLKNYLTQEFNLEIQKFANAFASNKINESAQFLIRAKYLRKSLADIKKLRITNS